MSVFKDYSKYYNLLYKDKDYHAEVDYVEALIKKYSKSNCQSHLFERRNVDRRDRGDVQETPRGRDRQSQNYIPAAIHTERSAIFQSIFHAVDERTASVEYFQR